MCSVPPARLLVPVAQDEFGMTSCGEDVSALATRPLNAFRTAIGNRNIWPSDSLTRCPGSLAWDMGGECEHAQKASRGRCGS